MTGSSSFLPVRLRGTARTGRIESGTWRGERLLRSAVTSRSRSSSGSSPSDGDDEQDELARTAVGVLEVHDEAVVDLAELLDDAVEVGRADAHAAAVERGVGAAGDHEAAALGEAHPVTHPPDAGVHVEVGGAVAAAVGVAPEADGHRGHRLADDELAELADDLVAERVVGGDVAAEARCPDISPA